MKYKDAVKKSMETLAEDSKTVFIGYNLKFGSKAYGSLKDVSSEKIIEMPVAENLMAGLGMGMGMIGFRPVVIYERHDFILNALDNIVNHLDKLKTMSKGQYNSPVISRAIVGSVSPINPGPQHRQDFGNILDEMLGMSVYDPRTPEAVLEVYRLASRSNEPSMIIERIDLYENV